MANSVAGQLLVYALLLFFVVVAVFLSYAIILHTEQSQMWSTIKDRGATRTMPNGTTNYWYYIVRDMDKIRNMTDLLHMDRSTHVVPTPVGFRVIGKDFEIHFDRINVTHAAEDEGPHQPQEDYIPTLVKRKTYVWEITRRQPTANITVPVFLGKIHDKQAIPPFQNAIPPPDSDTKKE
ncbi:uncharacterized protein LOC128299399 [Anopheles moucheti]|uniref:uncharacterized protein LOC128299399 n=1 Tax=Anopheles moucheti TaxID=186751 RepID=UPI0022F11E37|nr:uncharacterized protein LOC128299399 [Anopheles moucheti]